MSADFDELLLKAKDGCQTSLERMLMVCCGRLQRYIQPRVPSVLNGIANSDDIMQLTFTQAFLKISSFEGETEPSFFKWLKVIADRQIQDSVKSKLRKKRGGERKQVSVSQTDSALNLLDILVADQSTASRKLSRKEAQNALHICISELPEDYREILRLRYFDGLSIAEVAEATDRSEGAIRGILDRARAKLRDGMGRASQWLSPS